MVALLQSIEQQRNAALNQVAHATAQLAVTRAQLASALQRVAELQKAAEKVGAKKTKAAAS
jgi:ABC-type spermidine/putrescine transport system permease subunit II